MSISVPEEMSYSYESPRDRDRLLCWIPSTKLESLVNNSGVDKQILIDYLDGLDIEVSWESFELFKEKYNLDLGVSPDSILVAFEALQNTAHVSPFGDINATVVEELACEVETDDIARDAVRKHSAREATDRKNRVGISSASVARKMVDENPAIQSAVNKKLKRHLRLMF